MLLYFLIAVILLIVFSLRNKRLFNIEFGDSVNYTLYLPFINSYNAMNTVPGQQPLLAVQDNFFNYTANLILKFILFIIFIAIYYFSEDYAICSVISLIIFGLILILDWFVFFKRRKFYKNIPQDYANLFIHSYKACICGPLYQTILFILVIISSCYYI